MTSGIYIIRNNINGKEYVGSSINIERRWTEHKRELNLGIHDARHLQSSWNKYGKDNFCFYILETTTKEDLITREQYYIDTFCPVYNYLKRAGSRLGSKMSEESKRKVSIGLLGNKNGKGNKGYILTAKDREKISSKLLGNKHGKGNKGKHHSAETIEKIRQSVIRAKTPRG